MKQGNVPSTPSSPWLTTAVRNVTASGFQISLERSEVLDGNDVTVPETIAYLVMDVNTGSFTDVSSNTIDFESIYSDENIVGWSEESNTVPFSQSFSTAPLVIATKNTQNDEDGGWLRRCLINISFYRVTGKRR